MTWKEFAAVLGSKVPWVLHKMLNGMETSYFSFLLAQGHTTRVRGSIYLSIADRKKTERRHQWATVVTDQLTGQGYHIEGADCGLQYDGRATTCFCDALAWKLTAVEMKAYAQKGKADLAAWDLTLGNAVIIKDDKVFRIVDGRFFRDGREEALTFDEGELFDYGEEYNGYATKEIAESVLKDARDHRALEIKTAA